MSTTTESEFEDGTPIRFLLTPAQAVTAPGGVVPAPEADRPEGMGKAVPVAAGGRTAVSFATGALRGALRPLGPLLEEVHNSVKSTPHPPDEVSVTFGVQVGQDLKFGIVGGNGQAHLTVTAAWKPTAAADPATAPGAE
ncbi:CU044_2847 family protein [Streptomyces sp. NPDC050535]|uniref:CU044_2847 family protein n=1 Tax=Streptomyces sp. NPDC050535 TaxID=3365626 RepID=UPI0037994A58